MKGLLLKDWYMVLRYWKSMFIFNIIYAVIASFSSMAMLFALMNVLLGTMVVKSLMAYEEQNKWDCLAVNLPVTKRQIVTEKYLMGFGGALYASLLTAAVMSLINLLLHRTGGIALLPGLLMFVTVGMLLLSLELPVLFKFGTNKGRIWFIAVIVLLSTAIGGIEAASGIFSTDGETGMLQNLSAGSSILLILGLFLISCAAVYISIGLSVRFYEKREF